MEIKELGFETVCEIYPLLEPPRLEGEIQKHGDHDQSSHGNWASGNFDEETEYDDAAMIYSERYGVDNQGNKVGVSKEEHEAIDDYSQSGYKRINKYLRQTGDIKTELDPAEAKLIIENDERLYLRAIDEYSENNTVGEELTEGEIEDAIYQFSEKHGQELLDRVNSGQNPKAERNEADVAALDSLIKDAPPIFGANNLYRVFSNRVLDGLQEGDIMIDKGFISTTRIDITKEEFKSDRDALAQITPTLDTVGVILPNESKTGKGLAVDIYRTMVQDTSPVADNEKEILLPRDTPLKFIGYKTDVGTEAKVAVFQRMDK